MAFRIVGVKTNYSTKEIVCLFLFVAFFKKGGAHAPVAPPPPGYGLVNKLINTNTLYFKKYNLKCYIQRFGSLLPSFVIYRDGLSLQSGYVTYGDVSPSTI